MTFMKYHISAESNLCHHDNEEWDFEGDVTQEVLNAAIRIGSQSFYPHYEDPPKITPEIESIVRESLYQNRVSVFSNKPNFPLEYILDLSSNPRFREIRKKIEQKSEEVLKPEILEIVIDGHEYTFKVTELK